MKGVKTGLGCTAKSSRGLCDGFEGLRKDWKKVLEKAFKVLESVFE